ncbi:MAG TPA: hypothetical protein PLX54_08260 [Candidatus Fermentibacter daniensis]|jgi:hypothetical protein|nr:MAG: hypothetical protein AO396_06515 [Candidatus Fermentibacter daniensis]MBP7720185.1 hypothetical protein [Candidatus Fermentibacter sp.]OQC69347.1 MAG: hypothetical protein BWX47_01247 [candidate division Hyd24-12 bacterium ADurb.Bin004]KZD16436.1 MAG: hypothetical protein AO395_04600 [Candidatus Fermentibacter daniensis]KZD18272.1 MAG: hypothetical protein AO394_03565 [Candidatus Fermentibacter daniensis]
MPAVTRGWIVWTVILGSFGLFLLLWGLGLGVSRWWPILVTMMGVASLCRGMNRRENSVFGLLLAGWGLIGVAAMHGDELGITSIAPFLFGGFLLWIPPAILIARSVSEEKTSNTHL